MTNGLTDVSAKLQRKVFLHVNAWDLFSKLSIQEESLRNNHERTSLLSPYDASIG
jgi:hypothetical protein